MNGCVFGSGDVGEGCGGVGAGRRGAHNPWSRMDATVGVNQSTFYRARQIQPQSTNLLFIFVAWLNLTKKIDFCGS